MATISVAPAAFAPRTAALISSVYSVRPSWKSASTPCGPGPVCSPLTIPATPSMSLMMKTFTLVASHVVETGLAGKRVLVTGASGGIGSACARLFMAEGCEVVAHYHRGRDRAEALGAANVVGADLRVEAEVERLFEHAGPLDVCAAVAGIWPPADVPVWELP